MNYIIRLATENDLVGLCNIRNNQDLFTGYLQQYKKREAYLVIAEQSKTIIGFGVLKLTGSLIPKLSDLYVDVNHRGKGVGSALIKFRENISRDLGFSELFVSVDPIENPKMIKLISKHGFDVMSEQYIKTANFYNNDGTTIEKTYTRIDLKKVFC